MALQCEKIKQINIVKDVVLDGVSYTTGQEIEINVSLYTHSFYEDVNKDFDTNKSCSLVLSNDETIPYDTEDSNKFLLALTETLGYYNLYGSLLKYNPTLK
jgi:hypothetical protein